ncbi:hypothetical protein [Mariniflexile sp. HMF6888]|uniref:hypothetical protein n=1 Tax=Mariniflexile sp. HMF6888 TaxID=3373086 RepID=UPI003799560D
MSNNDKSKPMNFWQILDKIKYFVLAALFIIIIIILSKGYSIETSYFKIGKVPDTLYLEKEIKIPSDTIYKERVVTKYVEIPKKDKSTSVKNSETEIQVNNQPANINTGNNSGILGNNNTVNVNEKPLVLNDVDKQQLITFLEQIIKKNSLKPDVCIEISGLGSDSRSFQMAGIILDFLKSKKYNADGISQKWYNKPMKGIEIIYKEKCIEINVFII